MSVRSKQSGIKQNNDYIKMCILRIPFYDSEGAKEVNNNPMVLEIEFFL